MLPDLANNDGYVALKLAADDIVGWIRRERMSNKLLHSRRLLNWS